MSTTQFTMQYDDDDNDTNTRKLIKAIMVHCEMGAPDSGRQVH